MTEYLPVVIGLALLAVAGISELTIKRVPNILSLVSIIGALITSVFCGSGVVPSFGGTLGSAFVGLAFGFLCLIPFYALGLGAGCVKSNAAFGAWVGCTFGLPMVGYVVLYSTIAGVVLTAVLSALWVVANRSAEPETLEGGFDEQNPRKNLFPAQATLSAGAMAVILMQIAWG